MNFSNVVVKFCIENLSQMKTVGYEGVKSIFPKFVNEIDKF